MNAAGTVAAPSVIPNPARRVRRPRVFGNLLRKELRESRGAIVAGLAIFWLMPALWELIYAALDSEHELLPGFAWVLLAGAGWLYAIVVGGHTVCRDWGKPEEHFLLAQPVTPRSVIWAKLIAGAVVVFAVAAVAGAWDLCFSQAAGWERTDEDVRSITVIAVVVVGILGVGYGVAFAGAVVTRQMLASVLVAGMALVIWAVAPMVSTRLSSLHPTTDLLVSSGADMGVAFGTIVLVGIAGPLAVALIWSTRERVIRLGHKPLAWTAALVVLGLFGMAMTEVGNSLHVTDQARFWGAKKALQSRIYGLSVAQQGNRFVAVWSDPWFERVADWPMIAFEVNERGQITNRRKARLPGTKISEEKRYPVLTGLTVNDAGHLVATGYRMRLRPKAGQNKRVERVREGVWQTRFVWPEDGPPEILSHRVLPLPHGKRRPLSFACTERYAYLTYYIVSRDKTGVEKVSPARRLYVYEWSDGPEAKPRYEFPLPRWAWFQILDGTLHVYDVRGVTHAATFPADDPNSLATSQPWSFEPARQVPVDPGFGSGQREENLPIPLRRPGGGTIHWTLSNGLIYVADRLGIRIVRDWANPEGAEPVIVGEYHASPLSMLFSLDPQRGSLTSLNDSLLAEFRRSVGSALVVYDVSDPSRPRRAGFFNRPPDSRHWDSHISATERHLVLLEGVYRRGYMVDFMATVFDKPG